MPVIHTPQHEAFRERIARVQAAHSRGEGFETPDTIGRSAYAAPPRRRSLRRLVVVAATVFLVGKAGLVAAVGTDTYQDRVAGLRAGNAVDRIGAAVMTPDPLTRWLAQRIGPQPAIAKTDDAP